MEGGSKEGGGERERLGFSLKFFSLSRFCFLLFWIKIYSLNFGSNISKSDRCMFTGSLLKIKNIQELYLSMC